MVYFSASRKKSMTTAIYSTAWSHLTDADFRAWGSELSAAMQTCGLLPSADTGQINWTTVARPAGNNTAAGYEIYQFTDSLQATYPIFVKIEYGTGNTHTNYDSPALWITVGQGSNGSGTLTGVLTTRTQIMCNSSGQNARVIGNNSTSWPTFISFNGSYLGVALKIGGLYNTYSGQTGGSCMFAIGRAVDATGAYVGGKIMVAHPDSTNPASVFYDTAQTFCINTITGLMYSQNNGYFTFIPYSELNTSVGGAQFQVFPTYGVYPEASPNLWLLYGVNGELPLGVTIKATPVGAASHTYIMTGTASAGWGLPSNNNYSMLMLWE
jgi:hypothetical protein